MCIKYLISWQNFLRTVINVSKQEYIIISKTIKLNQMILHTLLPFNKAFYCWERVQLHQS